MAIIIPSAMKTDPKVIFFTDFDGTVTTSDSNYMMCDAIGYGKEKRCAANDAVLNGERSFRDAFNEMMDSVQTPFSEAQQWLLDNTKLDPQFPVFFRWARANNVPIVVLSGGMKPIIRALLAKAIGEEFVDEIEIISNDIQAKPGCNINDADGWSLKFRDDSIEGHDKSIELRKYNSIPADQRPIMMYAGDGVSDQCAARETDLLFAKIDRDLVTYCEREQIPFVNFRDWADIQATVQKVLEGKTNVKLEAKGRIY
ncbi:putative phosphatase YNL010W [Ceratocystis fimbriata CBS 114723]|uniref:Putative phosphatase YNL010W n=1 Tax=Ceratocystis fimbriata CBS 114723 TaxID=1035309 RepID=A0A2C5WZ46_9PEZI|nr:putative phosphatase YNL010W [Ceratocystis fimbriata CBS 114723]